MGRGRPRYEPCSLAPAMIITVPSMASRAIRPRRRPAAAQEEPVSVTCGREAVSAAKLITFINSEAQARPECAGVKVRSGAAGEFGEIKDAAIHNEGAVGATPAKLFVIYTVERGKPLVTPVK